MDAYEMVDLLLLGILVSWVVVFGNCSLFEIRSDRIYYGLMCVKLNIEILIRTCD